MSFRRIALNDNWRFKQATSLNNSTATEYHDVAQFPTVSHIDLLHHGLIKDPYIDMNELESLTLTNVPIYQSKQMCSCHKNELKT